MGLSEGERLCATDDEEIGLMGGNLTCDVFGDCIASGVDWIAGMELYLMVILALELGGVEI